jgi:hypothetical protein
MNSVCARVCVAHVHLCIYLNTKLDKLTPNGSLVITIKLNSKENLPMAAMLVSSKGFGQWCTTPRTTEFLDSVHHIILHFHQVVEVSSNESHRVGTSCYFT